MKSYLELTAFKHKVLSENLANVNTPGYKAEDVHAPKDYSDLTEKGKSNRVLKLVRTSDNHIADTKRSNGKLSSHKLKDPYEVKPNGNNVSLAQQMTKLSQTYHYLLSHLGSQKFEYVLKGSPYKKFENPCRNVLTCFTILNFMLKFEQWPTRSIQLK
jgi:flagellar basal-body rod protein FlgB